MTFLLAQYRAIFKRAYFKGLAAAVLFAAAGVLAKYVHAEPDALVADIGVLPRYQALHSRLRFAAEGAAY